MQHHAYADPDSRGAQASIVDGSRMLAAPMRRGSPHLACCLAPRPQLLQARRALLATDQDGMDRAHPDALRKFAARRQQNPQQAPMHAMDSHFGVLRRIAAIVLWARIDSSPCRLARGTAPTRLRSLRVSSGLEAPKAP